MILQYMYCLISPCCSVRLLPDIINNFSVVVIFLFHFFGAFTV